MANLLSSERLRKAFLAALEDSASWFEIWRLFVEDEWFQAELDRHAGFIVSASGSPSHLVDDVRHEAMLLLAAKLEASVDLGLDTLGRGENFAQSIGVIIRDDCHDAYRRLHRLFRTQLDPLPSNPELAVEPDRALELRLAIEDLPPVLSTTFRLLLMGYQLGEIAQRLNLKYKQVHRLYRRGLKLLRENLALVLCVVYWSGSSEPGGYFW